jgi:hypothetical protein
MGQDHRLGTRRWLAKAAHDAAVNVFVGHVAKGAWAISHSQRAQDAELHLLFARGKRPDRAALESFVARQPLIAISHDPGDGADPQAEAPWPGQQLWLELLRDGLTFDVSGLTPGPASPFPEFAHRFDLAALPDAAEHEALTLRPGPHLAGARNSLPLQRALLALACDFVRHFEDLAAVGWGPASSAIGRRFFESVASAWLDGGPFPALGLTAFTPTPDGALQTVGLDFWIGQELRIEPPLSHDRVAATRLGVRIVNHLVIGGAPAVAEHIVAPDGMRLVLRPSRSRALISVWRE